MNRRRIAIGQGLLTIFVAGSMLLATVQTEVSAEDSSGKQKSNGKVVADLERIPVYFEENRGQFHKKVRYLAHGTSGYDLFLTGTDAVYVVRNQESRVESGEWRA